MTSQDSFEVGTRVSVVLFPNRPEVRMVRTGEVVKVQDHDPVYQVCVRFDHNPDHPVWYNRAAVSRIDP